MTPFVIVSRNCGALYECTLCGSEASLAGTCYGCGAPSGVDGRPTRRHARHPARWMLTLAHNLTIGAALCEAHRLGHSHGYAACPCERGECDMHQEYVDRQWHPGCQRAAR